MNTWHKLHITDKNGGEHFRVTASPMSTESEIRNLKRHIEQAMKAPHMYKFLDAATAVVVLDGEPYSTPAEIDYDALLAELEM